ncbi:MAG: TetR/AcrR family transcriptional regulator [Fibrobacteres bacterium]|nr:TetR/AcrR family transcriptional regulator [Fibrobacterota bacterium]
MMGRRSLASERKTLIIEALAAVIREDGYEAATLERVAAQAGVQRTLIRHYFGNRDELIKEALVHITGKYLADYTSAVENLPAAQSIPALIDYLFGGQFNQRMEDDAVIDALIASSNQSDAAKSAVLQMYRTFEDTVSALLERAIPLGSPEGIKDVAYAMVCLAEQHAMMRSLGMGDCREAGLKRTALALIQTVIAHKSSRHQRNAT